MTSRSQALVHPTSAAFLLLIGATGLLWAGRSSHGPSPIQRVGLSVPSASPATFVPTHLGSWLGKPLAVTERALEILETNDVSLMEYRLDDQQPPVWFAQVAGFGNRAAFHPPELCYVGSHFEVLERSPITVQVHGQARHLMRLVISQEKQRFEAWYWFTANGRITPSYYQQQLWLLLDTIQRKPMSGTLVRISTPIETPEQSHARLLTFVNAWDTAWHSDSH